MMKVIYKIHLEEGVEVSGKKLLQAIYAMSQLEEFCSDREVSEMSLCNDEGDFYMLGLNSEYPNSSAVIVTLPDEKPEINFKRVYRNGDIAVSSWKFRGEKFAVNVSPIETKEKVLRIKYYLEKYLNP